MDVKSRDLKVEEAILEIIGASNSDDIRDFTEGDNRKVIISTAEAMIKRLETTKEGEVDSITQATSDFKEGVQATKSHITGEDVIKRMRAEGKKI
jgi:hypothetical protein